MAISAAAKAGMFSQETDEFYIALATIAHPTFGIYRFSSDPTVRISDDPLAYATFSRGGQFDYLPFTLLLPESTEQGHGNVMLSLSNIDRQLVPLIRTIPEGAMIKLELVLSSSLDTVELSLSDLEILHVGYPAEAINLTLGYQSLASEPFPFLSFSPNVVPGLFR